MSSKCTECGYKFTLRSGLCDDWKDPNKSFGCPECRTFYVKDMKPKYKESVKQGLFIGGIMVPASSLILDYVIKNGDMLSLFYGSIILLSAIGIWVLDSIPFNKLLVKSSYNKALKDDADKTGVH